MQSLEKALLYKDPDAKIFFAVKSLRAGGLWLPEVAREIAEATAFVLLVGENGIGRWQIMEYYEALDRRVKQDDFPVVVVLLDGQPAPGLPFLRQLHWVITPDPASEKSLAQLMDAVAGSGALSAKLWRHTAPYRGLHAMSESDTDFFFGRDHETSEVIRTIETTPDKLPVLLGNSGVGKSSVAQAGVLAALGRQAWPQNTDTPPEWPHAFRESRRWCFLILKPGTEPLKGLVEAFLDTWQLGSTDPERVKQQNGWLELLHDGKAMLCDLLDATERRYKELDRTKPPAFLLYLDQGEELYVRAVERQRRRFSEVIAQGIADPRLYTFMSMRTDFLGELQKDEPLYKVHRQINVPPLREAALSEVVKRPAELLSARFETAGLASMIIQRTVEDLVKDVGALPLLSYTLDDMWTQMVERDDGVLRLPAQSFELGGVLVDRADVFLAAHPMSQDELRRIFTLKLATVREGEEPIRRRAARSEFTDEEWRLVNELADHPNRLLITATSKGGEIYAEVAHEAVFRRWEKLRDWIAAEREFLAWRTGLEAARRAWRATPVKSKNEALLMGLALAQAQSWISKRDIPASDREFIMLSYKASQQRKLRAQALVWGVAIGEAVFISLGFVIWANQSLFLEQINFFTIARPYMLEQIRPYVLSSNAEQALRPGNSFRECAKYCPEMVVVPAGGFLMGSPYTEIDRSDDEGPQHEVTIARPFAVSKFEVTFADWDVCVSIGGCPQHGAASDAGWGRSQRPVINVGWNDAQAYVAWLSGMTGKAYRLLTEAEWEYAARAGTHTVYSWGDEVGKNNANCRGCGSRCVSGGVILPNYGI